MSTQAKTVNVRGVHSLDVTFGEGGHGLALTFWGEKYKATIHLTTDFWASYIIEKVWDRVKAWRKQQQDLEAEIRQRIAQ